MGSLTERLALEDKAKSFAAELVAKYKEQRAALPHLDTISIDYVDAYPEDDVIDRASTLLVNTWRIEAQQWKATSGRAGCFWVTPKFRYS
jgi:hypothetical protein